MIILCTSCTAHKLLSIVHHCQGVLRCRAQKALLGRFRAGAAVVCLTASIIGVSGHQRRYQAFSAVHAVVDRLPLGTPWPVCVRGMNWPTGVHADLIPAHLSSNTNGI